MILTIAPTNIIETFDGQPARRWEGTTDHGTPVHVWVRALSPQTHDAVQLAAFDRELNLLPPVEKHHVSFDFRFVS